MRGCRPFGHALRRLSRYVADQGKRRWPTLAAVESVRGRSALVVPSRRGWVPYTVPPAQLEMGCSGREAPWDNGLIARLHDQGSAWRRQDSSPACCQGSGTAPDDPRQNRGGLRSSGCPRSSLVTVGRPRWPGQRSVQPADPTAYELIGSSRARCRAWARSSFRRPWKALWRFWSRFSGRSLIARRRARLLLTAGIRSFWHGCGTGFHPL